MGILIIVEVKGPENYTELRKLWRLDTSKCSYQQKMSLNSFFFGKKRYNYHIRKAGDWSLYHAVWEEDWLIRQEVWQKCREKYPNLPETIEHPPIEVRDLYHFYELIGFDRKSKRYE